MKKEYSILAARERVVNQAQLQRLSCHEALAIAAETGLKPAELGKLCNELQIKITRCQLGCF